jgi:hypothetical protein
VKLSAYALEWRAGKPHGLSERAQLIGEVWGIWNPGVRVAVASTKLIVRGAQGYTAQRSINDLSGVLAQNWNAELHLRDKIRQLTTFMSEENRTIDSYRGLHPEAAVCTASDG